MKKLMILVMLCDCSSSPVLTGVGAFTPNTQLAEEVTDAGPEFGPSLGIGILAIASGPVTCADALDGGGDPLIGQLLSLTLFKADATLVTTGTYQIVIPLTGVVPDAGNLATLELASNDLDAGFVDIGFGISGTVTLKDKSPVSSGSFSATIQLLDGGGGTLTGNFDAPVCVMH